MKGIVTGQATGKSKSTVSTLSKQYNYIIYNSIVPTVHESMTLYRVRVRVRFGSCADGVGVGERDDASE